MAKCNFNEVVFLSLRIIIMKKLNALLGDLFFVLVTIFLIC